jgi:drug/metabolite transporter (DMT)-like permease
MNNNIKGLILIIIGMLFMITQDVLIKYIIQDASLMQILVFRSGIGLILLCIYFIYSKQPIYFGTAHPYIAIFRASTFFFGFTLFFISLSQITLAEATSLYFVSPFFITIYSYFILNIKIGLNRIFSIFVGFSGTLLIIKPEFNEINIYMLFPIIAAATYALSMTLAKKTSEKDNLFQQTFHIYIGAFIGGSAISILLHNSDLNLSIFSILSNSWVLNDVQTIGLILFISTTGCIGIFCLIAAYRVGSPLVNSIAEYVHLIFAIIIGIIIFSEIPDINSFIGIFLIIASGIFVVFRENKREELVVAETTLRT